jgi:hypothetical protein
MKQNTQDYDIFKDVEPFDISKHISQHVTTGERDKLKIIESVHVGGCYGTRRIFENKCIYNTTLKTVQKYDYYHHVWVDVPPATIKPMHNGHGNDYYTSTYYNDWVKEVNKAKEAYLKVQEIKHGEFHYLWKEKSTQTQTDIEEQSVQTIAITNEQDIPTKQVGIDVSTQTDSYVNLAVNDRDYELTKLINKFYCKFSHNEEIEEFYNQFLNIMEHTDSEILGDMPSL